MDSPDRNLTVTAAEVQGSPFFNFLCSLSPIKPAKSLHVAQTFSELTFPPPPPVFVSPRVDVRKELSRNPSRGRGDPGHRGSGSFQVRVETANGQLVSALAEKVEKLQAMKKSRHVEEKNQSPCSSPSKLIKEYLAEPIEDVGHEDCNTPTEGGELTESTMLPPSETDQNVASTVTTCKPSPQTAEMARGTATLKDDKASHALADFAYDGEASQVQASTGGESKGGRGSVALKENENNSAVADFEGDKGVASFVQLSTVGHVSESEGKEVLDLDQEAADLVFLMSEGAENLSSGVCLDDWQNEASVSEFPIQQVTSYMSKLKEFIDEDGQEALLDDLSSHMSVGAMAIERFDAPVIAYNESVSQAGSEGQGLPLCKANMSAQRGVRRRCLDFEVSERQWNITSLKSFHSNSMTRSQSTLQGDSQEKIPMSVLKERASVTSGATNSEPLEGLDSCSQACSSTRISRLSNSMLRLSRCSSLKERECNQMKLDRQLSSNSRSSASSPAPLGMPSGIGLHLNSLTGSMLFSSQASKEAEMKCTNSPSLNALLESPTEEFVNNLQANSPNLGLRQGVVVSCIEKTKNIEAEVETRASGRASSAKKSVTCIHSVTLGIKRINELVSSNGQEAFSSPIGGRKRALLPDVSSQLDGEEGEDMNQSPHGPKKKRKSSSATEKTGDGCKRCNCKKSKCLKLYCECFAAGIYCVDSCTCHGCFNKPEFEDTVMGTRQQIESRNPLAFAPKIVRAADSSPTIGEDYVDTPASSARHKRGCNCKKSQCLKKYCECYQAGVGCSDGCRCEGCKNLFGRKEGFEEFESKDSEVRIVDKEIAEEQFDSSELCNESNQASQQQHCDLSPITPSFQCAGSTVKSRSAIKRHFASDDFQSPAFSLSSAKPPRSPSRLLRSSKGSQNSSTPASSGIQLTKIAGSPMSTPKMLRIGQFSPRWDGLGDICTLTPLPHAPLRPTPASTSLLDGIDSSPSFTGQHCNELSGSANGSRRINSKNLRSSSPSLRSETPIDRQSSPTTPMFASSVCATGSKSQLVGEDEGTPEFLKDPDPVCSPRCILKTSSPRQKRVSPPHHHGVRESSHRGLQSPGLRSSRKFILQSIPSTQPPQATGNGR